MNANALVNQTVPVEALQAEINSADLPRVVAGYTLEKRIGAGGYGEVWRATGPGGLKKAVKILHGCKDGPQAETELRSLERAKELRHPFLLSIERIEVVEGRLIVVTELADGSLLDRFEQVRRDGNRGISRDVLLKYLRDAAEALDFLYQQHGLQHLDIKPDNLLFQGDHLKVGDYGLTRQIGPEDTSQVLGFTPLYSPPELFDGRPSPNSDQYSLAVVYQQMVTGIPPFSGRTAAQLAIQHLNSKPDLSALAPSDRPTVARALSKNPNARFQDSSCFVSRLLARKLSTNRSNRVRNPNEAKPAPEIRDGDAPSAPERSVSSQRRDTHAIRAVPLPPPEVEPSPVYCSPSLIVGLGGVATGVLGQLRRRMCMSFGHQTELPALPMLLLDTDADAIATACENDGLGLRPGEALAIPLADSNEYRQDKKRHLEWLSRRWLFNIPRSKLVAGMRPLGRLAFVDHHVAIRDRLRETVAAAMNEDAVRDTQKATGLPFDCSSISIYVVASTSGGTGSGCMLDFSYLLHDVLSELEITKRAVIGLLLHANDDRVTPQCVGLANTLAFLQELKYYSTPALGFPGDSACNLPNSGRPPFEHTYFVSMGDPSNEPSLDRDIQRVAEYLYRNTLTGARSFFEKCRLEERDAATTGRENAVVRSFWVSEPVQRAREDVEREAALICLAAVRKWCEESQPLAAASSPPKSLSTEWPQELLREAQLQTDQLAALAATIIGKTGGKRIEAYARSRCTEFASPDTSIQEFFHRVERDFSTKASASVPQGHPSHILAEVNQHLEDLAEQATRTIGLRILSLLDGSEQGPSSARAAIGSLVAELGRVAQGISSLTQQVQVDIARLQKEGVSMSGDTGEGPRPPEKHDMSPSSGCSALWVRYCMLTFCRTVYQAVQETVFEVRERTDAVTNTLAILRDRLREVDHFLSYGNANPAAAGEGTTSGAHWTHSLSSAGRFENYFRSHQKKPLADLARGDVPVRKWLRALKQDVFAFLLDDGSSTGLASLSTEPQLMDPSSLESSEATSYRVLANLPQVPCLADLRQRLADKARAGVATLPGMRDDLFLCCELEGLDLNALAARLASSHPDVTEMASRLHTRIDVEWE